MTARVDKRPAPANYYYRRGDTVAEPITIIEGGEPADLTGRTYRAQLRKPLSSEVAVSFTVDVETPEDGGPVILRLEPEVTETLAGRYAWDLEQTAGGVVRTLLAGAWIFDPDTTRDPAV